MPRSHLEVFDTIYTPGLRFAFTNIGNEDFTSYWAQVPIVVKPGDTIEISDITPIPGQSMGHNLAIKMTMELTDKIIMKEAKLDELTKNQPYYRSPIGFYLNVANQRKPYEDKILRKLAQDEESPAMMYMREKMKQEILAGGQVEQPPESITSALPSANFRGAITNHSDLEGFSEIKRRNEEIKPEAKKPVKTKTIKKPKDEVTSTTTA